MEIYFKLAIAFLPTGLIGIVAYKYIKEYLMNPFVVCISLILGGLVLIIMDKWTQKKSEYKNIEDISYKGAFTIGLIQCVSMIPGVSRSAQQFLAAFSKALTEKQAAEIFLSSCHPNNDRCNWLRFVQAPFRIDFRKMVHARCRRCHRLHFRNSRNQSLHFLISPNTVSNILAYTGFYSVLPS